MTRVGSLMLWFGLIAVGLLALRAVLRGDPTRRNLEIFTEMAVSQGFESFSSHADLPGQQTLQHPPPGTVVRGNLPFAYAATDADARRAGEELVNPLGGEEADALARGAELYRRFCTVCHDAAGKGRGPVVARGMLPPPSLLGDRARTMKDGQIFHLLTRGQGNMAPFAAQLTTEDRWNVILHVRGLQRGSQP